MKDISKLVLAPCPFCRYKLPLSEGLCDAVFDEGNGKCLHPYVIACSNCGCGGPPSETEEGAISAWNRGFTQSDLTMKVVR